MKKLFYALLLLNCPTTFAKTTLDVTITLDQVTENQKRTIAAQQTFDVTENKSVSFTEGNYRCTWEIINENIKTVSLLSRIYETKDGVETEIAHPFLVVNWGKKGEVTLGEKSKSSNTQTNLKVTALITQD